MLNKYPDAIVVAAAVAVILLVLLFWQDDGREGFDQRDADALEQASQVLKKLAEKNKAAAKPAKPAKPTPGKPASEV